MLSYEEGRGVIFQKDGDAFCFDVETEYESFVIWVTNPDPSVRIDSSDFDYEAMLYSEEENSILERYSTFLKDFAKKRSERLGIEVEEGFEAIGKALEQVTVLAKEAETERQ